MDSTKSPKFKLKGSGVKIRPCQPSDKTQIVQLVATILGKEFPKDEAAYPADDLQSLEASYPGPGSIFLVAEQDNRLVGTCGVKAENPKTAILRRFFVDSSCRGQGIGSRLLKEALQFCRGQGFREVIIRTAAGMEQAIRLCQSVGFKEDGQWTLGGVTLVRFRLGLE